MANVKGSAKHVFARRRPSHTGDYTLHGQEVRVTKYRDPPDPPKGPLRLDLRDVIPAAAYDRIVRTKSLTFHVNGDMGGIKYAVPQELVAKGMEADFANPVTAIPPAFLYITGDCVYYNGEIGQYYAQFYEPYEFYPAPIFAVPGNHDGENLEGDNSLDGFIRNFCQPTPVKQPESGDSPRTAMTQPNVYWTLLTPLANIVGLYSNVPAGGDIREPQLSWFINELATLPKNRPLIVTLHHPIYSADDHHSGSTNLKEIIEEAATKAKRHPDMIIAGHVHNYQRLTKYRHDGVHVPYLVTGAGGYHNLHHIRTVDGERMIPPVIFRDKGDDPVHLEAYSDDHHGFLRVDLTPELFTGRYYQVPRPQDPYSKGSQLLDYFEYEWKLHTYRTNTLGEASQAKTSKKARKR